MKHPFLTVLAFAGVAGVAAFEGALGIHQVIDATLHDLMQRYGLEVVVPMTFDNGARRGTIGFSNLSQLDQADIDRRFPDPFGKLTAGENTLQLQYPLDITKSSNPNSAITYTKAFAGAGKDEREKYSGKGIYDNIGFQDVPGRTIVNSPVAGFLTLDRGEQDVPLPNGADNAGALIDFVAPNGNHYRLSINGSTAKHYQDAYATNKTAYVFVSVLAQAPVFANDDKAKPIGSYGIQVRKGDPILQLIDTPTVEIVNMGLFLAREGDVGKPTDMRRPSIPTNIELLTTSEGKLVAPG